MIDLENVVACIDEARDMSQRLHGIDLDDADGFDNPRAAAAALTRDLLYLADRIDLASRYVREQYWIAKGYKPGRES